MLAEDDDVIYMHITLKSVPTGPRKDKPVRLALPHPIYEVGKAEVCLFVKDRAGEGHKEAKERHQRMERAGKTGISKVIGISQLRKKYESFEAKRNLCNQFDVFLADDRVLPSLPKLIGKSFFRAKKQPIPVNVRGDNWANEVRKSLSGTFMVLPQGSCLNIKVALATQSEDAIVENVDAALKAACEKIPKKFANVQAVFLKTAESAALPIYQVLPDVQKIGGSAVLRKGAKAKAS